MKINETIDTILNRRSIRKYKDLQIPSEDIEAILKSGMYAPNAGNQPWHFTVIENANMLKKLNNEAKANAVAMGGPLSDLGKNADFNCLYDAPVLIIVSADEKTVAAESDSSASLQNMLIAAKSLGIGSCWIFFILMAFYGQNSEELKKELKIPEGYRPYCAAVFGYSDENPNAQARKDDIVTFIK